MSIFVDLDMKSFRALSALVRSALVAACLIAGGTSGPADAQDVKDLMGRSQSDAQQRAVEDLIRKLQGGAAKKDGPSSPGPAPSQTPASSQPTQPVAPVREATPAAPQAPRPPAQVALPSPAKAPEPEPITSDPNAGVNTPAPAVVAPAPVRPAPAEPGPARPAPQPSAPAPAARVEPAALDVMPSVDIEIYFDYNSASITPQAAATLAVLAQALSDPRLAAARFLIGGHTDAKGGADYNLDLSERRAQSVRRFLIDKHGIEAGRLVAQGFGSQRLKVPARPMAVENRRVQVVNLTGPAN